MTSSKPKIRVLVVEDSPTTRMFLANLLNADPDLRVVGAVGDGEAAVDFVTRNETDVVLMDIYMPRLDGFEATRRIMETHPLPIVICSSIADPKAMDITFRTLEAGALVCVEKPEGREAPDFAVTSARLLEAVKLMSEVKVVRRSSRPRLVPFTQPAPAAVADLSRIAVIGIGASTGGPPVLQTILDDLPKGFPVPILVVQHIAPGFLSGMVEWLNQTTALTVQIASHGLIPLPGHVYLAPDDFHLGLGPGGSIALSRQPPENGLRPSVSWLFRSLASTRAPHVVGVLLTGMGRDGADELKLLRDKGAVTIAQDRESSVVFGMPAEAIAVGGAMHVLPAEKIASALLTLILHRSAKEARS